MSESSNVVLRKLRASDIPAAAQLSAEAGWNQTEEDWRLLIDLAPEGCLAIEVEGATRRNRDTAVLWKTIGMDRHGANEGALSWTWLCPAFAE